MSPYTFLILLLPVLQGCLVVRTPKCECPVLEMSSSNIVYNVGNHSFYQNVSGYPLVEPVVKSEDCSVSMYCEGDDSLIVFDKDNVTMEENLKFECRASKTWTVRLSEENIPTTNIKFLNVGCYKQETCNPTIPCSYKAVDKASDLIDFPYYENLSGHKAKAPEVTIDGCYVTMTCDETHTLITMDFKNTYPRPYNSERAQCLPGRWWRLTEFGPLGIFLAICVEL
ncbi:hypothetical protein CAEBREN_15385 [Caenorhabditis brenneri]|uniref:Uncharacterized protein n=1 Tax=Caenorhabditis brenneri TaxID=135651 RepID=G0P1X8_CAEBE|nr:hypothetical protein CAEBREN_15385 [Caenorhabditis brenneri]